MAHQGYAVEQGRLCRVWVAAELGAAKTRIEIMARKGRMRNAIARIRSPLVVQRHFQLVVSLQVVCLAAQKPTTVLHR